MRKNNRTILRLLTLSLILLLALTACGGNQPEETEDPNAAVTHVVETAMAAITQTAAVQSPTPSSTPTLLPTGTNTPIPTFEPSPTLPLLPTATSVFNQPNTPNSSCDIGNFVKDVTIPDGTSMSAGQKFTKTWEIKNSGTCTWNENYQIIFYGGERMAEDTTYNFTDEDIEPGESVQISLEMTAPSTNGTYYSYWILRNDARQNFFVDGGSIYVQIAVGGTATPGPTATTANTAVPNDAPTVSITAPANGTSFASGAEVTLTGVATDTEDDNSTLTNSIVWSSDIDGPLGTAGSLNYFLSDGTHIITAKVTDSGGKFATATITIMVGP